jgi:hypothetical protein
VFYRFGRAFRASLGPEGRAVRETRRVPIGNKFQTRGTLCRSHTIVYFWPKGRTKIPHISKPPYKRQCPFILVPSGVSKRSIACGVVRQSSDPSNLLCITLPRANPRHQVGSWGASSGTLQLADPEQYLRPLQSALQVVKTAATR